MHIEAWFLIEAIIASVYLSSEPDSFASASSLAISELTGIDELVVDLSSVNPNPWYFPSRKLPS
jgi:hypothetical protein